MYKQFRRRWAGEVTYGSKEGCEKVRGVFERPKDSGVWGTNYYVNGNQHREKVGNKSAAIELYRKRKNDAREGRKLPDLRSIRVVTLAELADDAVEFAAGHKDHRSYVSKAKIVKKALGSRSAAGITPQELERWLRSHCESAATSNRYKAFVSLCYREGIANGKVVANPARLLRIKKEPKGRQRFLSREEYDHLFAAISHRCPEHVAEFIVSVHTGMRLSEQDTIEWGQVSFERRTIELDKTKNGDARTVHLNGMALGALRSIYPSDAMPKDRVFPREGSKDRFNNRAWFVPCLAEAGIQDYVWHSNRHTMCSWLAMAGASIKEIQEAAGHKTITMSARYSHLSPEHRLSAMERIG